MVEECHAITPANVPGTRKSHKPKTCPGTKLGQNRSSCKHPNTCSYHAITTTWRHLSGPTQDIGRTNQAQRVNTSSELVVERSFRTLVTLPGKLAIPLTKLTICPGKAIIALNIFPGSPIKLFSKWAISLLP
jgi:hypothetical protein